MSSDTERTTVLPEIGDPAALGLAGFGLTTLVLSFGNAGIIKEPGGIAVVFGLAIFYGGLAQLVAGIWEFRRGNTFGATAFFSYGAFWLSFWWINTHPVGTDPDIHESLGLYLIGWAIFTAYMTLAALRTSTITLAVFAALTLTFVFLGIGWLQNQPTGSIEKFGGYLGILTAVLALYNSAAVVVNATHRRDFLPTWPR
ncbi:MAG TPA: acetate uptake transporter [Actinocrinis sp.]|nr:acetate uptake transporter [Actinocrinis sp.]